MRHFDAVVVGSGAMGSFASYNLAKRGLRVLTLERFSLNHDRGSSHGQTRIIRLAYYEDERYVPLLKRALAAWRELEELSGRRLLTMTGGLMIGRPDGELVSGVLRSAKVHGLPHRVMSSAEATEEYSAFELDEGVSVVQEQNAGILYPEACIEAAHSMAAAAGCEFHFSEPATRWHREGDRLVVDTQQGEYNADRVVLAAGAWNTSFVGGAIPLECERQVPFWFPSTGKRCFFPDEMPVFILEEDRSRFFYGIPDVGHGVKVARSHQGRVVDPDYVDRGVSEEDLAPVEGFVAHRLPELGRVPVASASCLYTNTPDRNFVVGTHPYDRAVVVVSACSGHGFKFASVLGEVVADIASDRAAPYDISFLGADRFLARR